MQARRLSVPVTEQHFNVSPQITFTAEEHLVEDQDLLKQKTLNLKKIFDTPSRKTKARNVQKENDRM
jgi:hypothetical protein